MSALCVMKIVREATGKERAQKQEGQPDMILGSSISQMLRIFEHGSQHTYILAEA